MHTCPICKKPGGVLLATTVSPCDECYGKTTPAPAPGREDPTGLTSSLFLDWLRANPGVVAEYQVYKKDGTFFTTGKKTRIFCSQEDAVLYFSWNNGRVWERGFDINVKRSDVCVKCSGLCEDQERPS